MNEWQPIETAPNDVWILVHLAWNNTVTLGKYGTGGRWKRGWRVIIGTQSPYISNKPLHWMPLPDPPKAVTP